MGWSFSTSYKALCALVLGAAALAAPLCATAINNDAQGRPVQAYLPSNIEFDTSIPTPESVLGAQVGAWHVRPDQLVSYMHLLAKASPRVQLIETGRTHENRPLLLMVITDQANQAKVDGWREEHLSRIQSGKPSDAKGPLFLYMGYSIHGNEPSGSNAAMVVAYYLAAAKNPEVQQLLKDNVVLLDPSLNPDGLGRFAHWANMHRGQQLAADPEHREHREGWPSGRTNHYWFDLNRDWLLLTHPESQARIKQFHRWRPHVLTDFHEMGTNSTYFFQPGVPSRQNPLTPEGNYRLTAALAEFHANALDAAGELYFTEEDFDDFYFGKGSTYPDAHGSIGILFEQASSRGHLQQSVNGLLSFSDTIANQVTTTLSTFAGALANKAAILNFQTGFYRDTQKLIQDDKSAGFLVKVADDHARMAAFLDKLRAHQIRVMPLSASTTIDGNKREAGKYWFVSLDQPQYRLIKSLFSTQQRFTDNTFYDVSNWNIALAFNLSVVEVDKRDGRKLTLGEELTTWAPPIEHRLQPDAVAYAFEWHHYHAPALAYKLLAEGMSLRSAAGDFSATLTSGKTHAFAPGTLIVPNALNTADGWQALLEKHAKAFNIPLFAIKTGLTTQGADLGSRDMAPLSAVKVAIVGGMSTSQYDVGEIWHHLDTRVQMPVSLIELERLGKLDLNAYTHLVMTEGSYKKIDEEILQALSHWVKAGGVLIGQQAAIEMFIEKGWLKGDLMSQRSLDDLFPITSLRYADKEALVADKLIAGAAYDMVIDPSHPLFFGYQQSRLAVFKTDARVIQADKNPFLVPARYTNSPLLAGYTATPLVNRVAETAAVLHASKGKGLVIGFVDNTQFRGYWYGTDKLLSNAIFQSVHLK